LNRQTWFAYTNYVAAALLAGATLPFSYRLLTSSGQIVVSIDSTGFKDIRLTQMVIPWSAIQSVSPYIPRKSRTATGIEVAIDPAYQRRLSIRLEARLFNWANLLFGPVVRLDTRVLDVDCNEISRVAGFYVSKEPKRRA
jgi:hypothetical protein